MNRVELDGIVAAEPVERQSPWNQPAYVELRITPIDTEPGVRTLPLPVRWAGTRPVGLAKYATVRVVGRLERRFVRSGSGAHSTTTVVAESVTIMEPAAAGGGE